jgi:hypothetical protein
MKAKKPLNFFRGFWLYINKNSEIRTSIKFSYYKQGPIPDKFIKIELGAIGPPPLLPPL